MLKQMTIEAQQVKIGDKIYDKSFYHTDKWVKIKGIELLSESFSLLDYRCRIMFDVGYCKIGAYHPRQGIAVLREAS